MWPDICGVSVVCATVGLRAQPGLQHRPRGLRPAGRAYPTRWLQDLVSGGVTVGATPDGRA